MGSVLPQENLDNMALANRVSYILKKLMENRSITTNNLSIATNIPYPTLAQLLQGRNTYPKINNLLTLAKHFDISVDQLIGERTLSSASINNEKLSTAHSASQAWRPDFFISSCNLFNKFIKEKNIASVSAELALKIIKEIYYFSLERKIKKPDKQFADWIINQYF